MKQYWSKKAAALSPYVAGEQPKEQLIKLNTNENAYPPSRHVMHAIAQAQANLRLYPHPDAWPLKKAISEVYHLPPENIFCANGSDEALALSFLAFFDPGSPVLTLDVTYSFYPVWAQLFGITLQPIPLKEDFTVDVDALCGGHGVVIANPNAPTGIALSVEELTRIVESTDGVVIVDEAYVAFGAHSMIGFVKEYNNLVVVRTLSKSHSLAGLRVGYIAAHENLIRALLAVKDSFNSYPLDMLAQAGGAAALRDVDYFQQTTLKIISDRERTAAELERMGIRVLQSRANFLFVQFDDAAHVFSALRERGILVRHFAGGRTDSFLRVTIGTTEQMKAFIDAVREII